MIDSCLKRLPRAIKEHQNVDSRITGSCVCTPHSLPATTATLLLDAGVDIRKVQELLGHRHITMTRLYDRRPQEVTHNIVEGISI